MMVNHVPIVRMFLTEATSELFDVLYPDQLAGIIGLEEQEEWDD